MSIRVWRSYSCNNSSSFRLVARFADAAAATDVAAELRGFFDTHAKQMDAVMGDGGFPDTNPEAAKELATKYGFAWGDVLTWGDEMLEGDEPSVTAEGEVLVVYHSYCGGFGDVPAYLTARGAHGIEPETTGTPSISVLFRAVPGASAELDAQLAKLFGQIDEESRDVEPLKDPWGKHEAYGTAAFFRDSKTVGMYIPIAPTDLPAFKAWLADHGVANPSIRICEYADEAKFVAIAAARCTSCGKQLDYLDPRLDDIETAQLVCTPCGGFYDLATFLPD